MLAVALPTLEERRCFTCERPYKEHDNSSCDWGSCRAKHVKQQRSRKRFGLCEGWCNGKAYPFSELTVHHIHPQRLGGNNRQPNMVPLCQPCHDYQEMVLAEIDDTYLWAAHYQRAIGPITGMNKRNHLLRRLRRQEKEYYKKALIEQPS